MRRKIINKPVKISEDFNDKFYRQNPALMEKHTIPLKVNRFFTDVNGTIIAKGAAPAAMQTKYPVFLLGQFDRNGGYKQMSKIVPTMPGTYYLMSFTYGINAPFLSFTGANNIKGQCKIGDIVTVFTDDLENPNFYVWIIIDCESVSLASVINNSETQQADNRIGSLFIHEMNYFTATEAQYNEPHFWVAFDNIGNSRFDTLNPSLFRSPFNQQNRILTLTTTYKLDQYIGLCFYLIFDCDTISLDLLVEKI